MAATEGVVECTSVILSASIARSSNESVSEVEARTNLTLVGKRCKNNSRRRELSVEAALSPRSRFSAVTAESAFCLQAPQC